MSKITGKTVTASSGKAVTKAAPASKARAKTAAAHILSPAKGPRTLTHREIKQAVKKVFEERYGRHG